MNNIKYTNDGKKVVVIGKLNNSETIVQEIYVSNDGSEIPSGEQFVVKSLHDKMVDTWHNKHEKEVAESIKRNNAELEKIYDSVRVAQSKARIVIDSLQKLKPDLSQLDMLEKFVSGKIKYLVKIRYGYEVTTFDDAILEKEDYGRGFAISVRLLSLFGRTDGNLGWRIHQYYDMYGGSYEIHPFESIEEVNAFLEEDYGKVVKAWREKVDGARCPSDKPLGNIIEGCQIAGVRIEVPDDVKAYHDAERRNAKLRRIAELKAELLKLESMGGRE